MDAEIACRGTGGVGNAGAGSPGDASATNARHALLLARRALSTNAEALTLAHAERDALQKELDAAINSLVVGSKWKLDQAVLCACQQGRADCLYLLLEAGADKDARDEDGRTAMHLAAQNGHKECLQSLLEAGADKDARGRYGWAAMHLAARHGHEGCLESLLEAGADADKADHQGSTPLHHAAREHSAECVRLLLEAGADPSARDCEGRTALELAEARWRWSAFETVALLRQWSAPGPGS